MSRTAGAPPSTRPRLFPRLRTPVVVTGTTPPRGARAALRHARRGLLWGGAAFAMAAAALSAAVETVLPQVRDPEYGYRLVRIRALQNAHPNRPLVVVVGTSRTQNAIDPRAMGFPDEPGSPLVFNFGQSGARPPHLRLTLERLRADGVRPAAVLVEILPATLAAADPCDDLFRDHAARLTAADLRAIEPDLADPAALRRRRLGARANPWHAHRTVILSHVAPAFQTWPERLDFQWVMTDDRGFSPYPHATSAADRERLRGRAHANYAGTLRDLRVSELAVRSFRAPAADCRAAGVPVAFYLAPESPVFRSWYSPASREAIAAFTGMLRDELGCPVFDAPTDCAEEDFADGHHVLRPAAARFSRALADRHLRSWLKTGR